MTARSVASLARFELRRRWDSGRLPVALVLVAGCSLALGMAKEAGHLRLPDTVRLYGYVQLVTLALVYRFDLAHDMDHGFADVLAPNLVEAGPFVLGRITGGLAALAQFSTAGALVVALVPGLDLRFAVWTGLLWLLAALAAAPLVLLCELWLHTRLPVLAVTVLTGIAALAVAGMGEFPWLGRLLGTQRVSYGSFASLGSLALRGTIVAAAGLTALYPLVARHWAPGLSAASSRRDPPARGSGG